ncbi:VirB7 protein, type IV secretion system [Xanthomonas fragariae]|uniref:VirB7 protein, type IV secretion system n=2 Tax=Xanthomonas fragariae TaxID=48664 RepID=A0A1Y6HHB9_9XANT|nr:VirB7 protein, type IV secretion system [Xanthomonas fragariae]
MDSASAYSFSPVARLRDADWPVLASSGLHAPSNGLSKAHPLRHLQVIGAVVLSVLSPKFHELEKSRVNPMYVSKLSLVLVVAVMVGACATKPAPDFGGRWKHVNHFDEAPTEIPLYTSYTYQATQMDGTLKTMLERWAADSNMQLSYNLPSDYTLITPVSNISTTSVQQAATELSAVYAAQGISVSVSANKLLVQPVPVSSGAKL